MIADGWPIACASRYKPGCRSPKTKLLHYCYLVAVRAGSIVSFLLLLAIGRMKNTVGWDQCPVR